MMMMPWLFEITCILLFLALLFGYYTTKDLR